MKALRIALLSMGLVLTVAANTASGASAAEPRGGASASSDTSHGRPESGARRAHRGPEKQDLRCIEPVHNVKRQGVSCRVANGLLKVKLKDGSFIYTHGPDKIHKLGSDAPADTGQTGDLGAITPRNPVCTSANPHGAYGFRAIVAIPSDGSQTLSTNDIRTMLQTIDGAFYKSAVESGSPNGGDLVFDCDSTGAIAIDIVRLTTTTADSSFSSIVSDLEAKGYSHQSSNTRNYAVFFTATMGYGGEGSLTADTTNSSANLNNVQGGRFAINYGIDSAEIMMHEIGHNLGAVQPGAPYATGSGDGNWGHCWEAQDVMCYNDGGSTDPGYIQLVCADFDHFDCGHDDYFDAKIGAGQGVTATSWLATHFNIGACYYKYIVNRACTVADTTAPAMSAPTQSIQTLSQIGGGLVPVAFSWSATDASGIAAYEVWFNVNGSWFQMPSVGTAKTGSWNLTPGSTYFMSVRAKDTAGNWSGWANSQTFTVDAFQENAYTNITYSTGWTVFTGSYFGGKQFSSAVTNATAEITFTGRSFAWYAAMASNRGQAYITIDNVYIGSLVDTKASSTSLATAVFTKTWSTSGKHTVKIKVVGTSGRPTIDVDAFVALR